MRFAPRDCALHNAPWPLILKHRMTLGTIARFARRATCCAARSGTLTFAACKPA